MSPLNLAHKKLIIFDWDGTLMDSVGLIAKVLVKVAHESGLELTHERAASIIGLSLPTAMQQLFGERPDLWEHLQSEYKRLYVEHVHEEVLFEGVIELLRSLGAAGYTLAVATGKSRAGLDRVLDRFEVGHLFAATRTADEARSKPDPDMLEQILFELNFTPDQAVMIGDSVLDLAMAKSAKVDALGVCCGVGLRVELEAYTSKVVDQAVSLAVDFGV